MRGESDKQLGAALGRIPSGLFILTASQGTAETGMLVSWVQQCSFEPPQISLAIQSGRDILAWLGQDAPFTLNILDSTQTDMIVHFGRGFELGEPAFGELDIERKDGWPPILPEALAWLHCRVVQQHSVADHALLVARVTAGGLLGEGSPMIHVRKSGFHY